MKYRIWSNFLHSDHPANNYYAGYIDEEKEARRILREKKRAFPNSTFELHEFECYEKFKRKCRR